MGRSLPMRLSAEQIARIEAGRMQRAAAADVVISGVKLKPSQRDALIEAERLAKGGLSERRKAMALVRGVEAQLRASREGVAVAAGIEDTLARAAAKGATFEVETVDVGQFRRDGDGALVRIKGQPVLDVQTVRRARRADGLRSLHRAGQIDDATLEALEQYRGLYASAQPPMAASAIGGMAGGVVDREAPMAAAISRGFAAQSLSAIRAEVGDAAATLLEAVAGRGDSIRRCGGAGRGWEANRALLVGTAPAIRAALKSAKR